MLLFPLENGRERDLWTPNLRPEAPRPLGGTQEGYGVWDCETLVWMGDLNVSFSVSSFPSLSFRPLSSSSLFLPLISTRLPILLADSTASTFPERTSSGWWRTRNGSSCSGSTKSVSFLRPFLRSPGSSAPLTLPSPRPVAQDPATTPTRLLRLRRTASRLPTNLQIRRRHTKLRHLVRSLPLSNYYSSLTLPLPAVRNNASRPGQTASFSSQCTRSRSSARSMLASRRSC
jgi:hypothetical protein